IDIERDGSALPAVAWRHGADHYGGIKHMIVEREIVGWDLRDAPIALRDPVFLAQFPGCFQQFRLGGLSRPIALKGEFQFATTADARHAKGGDRNFREGHFIPQWLGAWCERTPAIIQPVYQALPRPPGHPARGRSFAMAGLLARGSSPSPVFP